MATVLDLKVDKLGEFLACPKGLWSHEDLHLDHSAVMGKGNGSINVNPSPLKSVPAVHWANGVVY